MFGLFGKLLGRGELRTGASWCVKHCQLTPYSCPLPSSSSRPSLCAAWGTPGAPKSPFSLLPITILGNASISALTRLFSSHSGVCYLWGKTPKVPQQPLLVLLLFAVKSLLNPKAKLFFPHPKGRFAWLEPPCSAASWQRSSPKG